MTDESIPRSHNVYPLYYPADRDERSAASGNAVVHFSHRFRRDEDHNTWYVGPMSQKFMSTQAAVGVVVWPTHGFSRGEDFRQVVSGRCPSGRLTHPVVTRHQRVRHLGR